MRNEVPLRLLLLSSLLAGCRNEAHGGEPPGAQPAPPTSDALPVASAEPPAPPSSSATAAPLPDCPAPCPVRSQADCKEGEVFVPPTPAGGFLMGRSDRGATDKPHQVTLTKGFCMDSTEVTVQAYKACVEAGACQLPFQGDLFATYPRHPNYPVNMVNWKKSRTYCAWVGKRLPTEAEWEWAATGPDGTKYPWGNAPEPVCGAELADFTPLGAPKSNPGGDFGCFGGGPSAVKSHPKGAKHWPDGNIYDLAGNLWEWTEDSYEPYSTVPQADPLVRRETANHAIRGGGWNRHARALQGWFRGSAIFTYQVPGLGFRCVRGAPHPTPPPRGGL